MTQKVLRTDSLAIYSLSLIPCGLWWIPSVFLWYIYSPAQALSILFGFIWIFYLILFHLDLPLVNSLGISLVHSLTCDLFLSYSVLSGPALRKAAAVPDEAFQWPFLVDIVAKDS